MEALFTLGHSTRSRGEFLRILSSHRITAIADVRSVPESRRHPQFNQDTLFKTLAEHGIEYHWLGESLGGFREGGYTKYMKTGEFEKGLGSLEDLADRKRAAILCAEADPRKCHRRFVADALVGRGWRVVHILSRDRLEEHGDGGNQGDLF